MIFHAVQSDVARFQYVSLSSSPGRSMIDN